MDEIAEELDINEITKPNPFDEKSLIVRHQEDKENLEDDFHRSRESIINTIESTTNVVRELAEIANQSEKARDYEVLGNLVKQLTDMNMSLLDLHKKRKEIIKEEIIKQNQLEETGDYAYVGAIEDLNI